jgi:mitogen-activated protein kinase kinase kinase 9
MSFLILGNARDFLRISSEDLELHEEIGHGAFGVVHRATWVTRRHIVAIKKLPLTHLTQRTEKEFYKELSLMDSIRCPYIINLYGACTETGKYALVMEYMPLGSLYKVLHEDKLELEWSERLVIALQTAKGINYLHQLEQPILHRDIKSLNFLLERAYRGYTVKVCDFGLAKTRNETTQQTKSTHMLKCTLQWTAPEILRCGRHTDKSDIYSLGVVYWELVADEIPYEGHQDVVIRESVLAGDRLEIPESTPSRFKVLIERCWTQTPNDRPNSLDVIKVIENCIETQSNFVKFSLP